MNMPQDLFEKWIVSERPLSAEAPLLVVCAIGERSRHYAAYLCSRGYKAHNLDGGIMAWMDRGQAAA
jgi:cysteine synthase B